MAFEPRPTFNRWNRQQQIVRALDTPFGFGQAFGENLQQGFLDSFGIGTVARDLMSGGNAARPSRLGAGANPMLAPLEAVYGARDTLFPDTSRRLDKAAYEASPYYRPDIEWDPGFTEDRAASLAAMRDKKKVREHFSQKQPVAAFLGQMGGQLFDPINYVPVFGEAVQAAAVAKFGSVAGRMMVSASDAAINTAAFGVLSAPARDQFGDDVTWQAMTSDIATGALLGAAFGGLHGIFARKGDIVAKTKKQAETLGRTMEARAAINDAVTGLVDNGEVRLSPNSHAVVEKMNADVTAASQAQRSLRDQTAGVTGSKAGEVVISPSGARVSVRPELVEASSLTHASGALQVRDRSSGQSAAQVEQIATSLDPARLMPNIDGAQGAPLVGSDNVIDSGNGRVMAINRAYDAYPEKAAAYRQALVDAGYPEAATMERPVLVSRRLTELTPEARAQFNADLNGPTTARMTAVELAAMDRAALDEATLATLDDAPVTGASNRAFVARFLGQLPVNERGAMVDGQGNLSADGARRIENALVAAAYGDEDATVLRRFAEATDDNTRAIVGAMSDVAGRWARMRHQIKRGEIGPEFDMTPELTQAVRLLGQWRDQAARESRPVSKVIAEGLAQLDLLAGEISPEAQTFVRMFYKTDAFTQAVGRDTLAARLNRVIDATEELGRPSLFGDALMPTKGEVLTNAQREQADIFAADGLEPRPASLVESGERSASGEAGAGDRPATESGDAPNDPGLEAEAELYADQWPDDHPAGGPASRFDWDSRVVEYPIAKIEGAPNEAWFDAEDADRFDGMMDRDIEEPVLLVEVDGKAYIWDGNHRTAAQVKKGAATVLAQVGRLRDRPEAESGGIAQSIEASVAGAGRPADEAAAVGRMVESFYSTLAARLGTTADELAGTYGLPEFTQGGDLPAGALQQAPAPDTQAFKSWFGDSKVVDAEGKPLVVYHGTNADFEAFDPAKVGSAYGTDEQGFYFTSSESEAQKWADRAPGASSPKVLPVYLSMQNPWIIDAPDGRSPVEYFESGEGVFDRGHQAAVDYGISSGYDGMIVRGGDETMFVAFSPEQIKSVDNRGTFDPADPRLLFQPAYHGSPHLFDKFSTDKIGTGEGAQAYGWGLYFAGKKDVAEYYRDNLSSRLGADPTNTPFNGKTVMGWYKHWEGLANRAANPGTYYDRMSMLEETELNWNPQAALREARENGLDAEAIKWFEETIASKFERPGRLYQVDVPGDDELLVWDKPLSEQPDKVKAAIERLKEAVPGEVSKAEWLNAIRDGTVGEKAVEWQNFGEALHSALSDLAWKVEKRRGEGELNLKAMASEWLREAGIPGHRYLDEGSRAAGEGSYNYVIYDDNRVNVTGFEQGGALPRGAISLDTNVIRLFETADASTALHETGHLFLGLFKRIAEAPNAPADIRADFDATKAWWGENADAVAKDANASGRAEGVTAEDVRAVLEAGTSGDKAKDLAIDVGLHEQWARGFEAYLREGKAPSTGLASIFEQFKRWLTDLYRDALALDVKLNDDIRGVFDRLLAPTAEQRANLQAGVDQIASLFTPDEIGQRHRTAEAFKAAQPARSIDDTYQVIGAHQDQLHAVASELGRLHNAEWKNPGIKKMARKGYESTAELTDLVRGGFVVKTPADAEAIIAKLGDAFEVFDEGWVMTAANYFDRKVLVRFDDGTIGEVQFWHPEMLDAKQKGGGHALYEAWRKLDRGDPRREALLAEQRRLYSAALPETDPAWVPVVNGLLGRASTPGNVARSADSLMGRPESTISASDASSQPLLDLGTNQPLKSSSMTAARPSQLKNSIGETPSPSIDRTEPAPDPVPEGLVEAAARVGQGENLKQLAESHGVAEDGSFAEEADIEQLRSIGALSPEDEAELAAAQQAYDDAEAYANVLKAVTSTACGVL